MFSLKSPKAQKTKPAKEARKPVEKGVAVGKYRQFCYALLGERIDRGGTHDALAERLRQGGINVTPGVHIAVRTVSTLIAFLVTLAVSFVIFYWIISVPYWYLYLLGVVLLSTGVTYGMFGFLIGSRIANRREELERELPFSLSELSVMASTGMSPIQLVRRMAQRTHDPAMTSEFKRVIYKTDVQGKDLITAFAETAKESSSNSLREAFWDLANMIHQGGSLDEYLRTKAEDVLKLKRVAQKEFIERLIAYVDMYISLVLIGVLMIGVGAFLINSLGSTTLGLTAGNLLTLLTYGIVPLAITLFTILIMMAYHRQE